MHRKLARYDIFEQTALVTIDNPPVNALDMDTREAFGEIFLRLDEEKHRIRAVVLRGEGKKGFAAGADISTFLYLEPNKARKRLSRTRDIYSLIEGYERPVIAAIHGFCLGGGLGLELGTWSQITATEDMKKGARAFLEKRKLNYRCR